MIMPVLLMRNDETKLMHINLNEVLFASLEDSRIVYHTANEKYFAITRLSDLDYLSDTGLDFKNLDRTNYVNMNQVQSVNFDLGNIYFDENPTESSKYATMAQAKAYRYKSDIIRSIETNTNKAYTEFRDKKMKILSASEAMRLGRKR
jgi:hypothetical protein